MISFSQLSPRKQALLAQSIAHLETRWDESSSMLFLREDGIEQHGSRATAYYALALLIRNAAGDAERANRAICAVLALQRLNPNEIWHGTFANSAEQPQPVASCIDMTRLTPEARWQGDILWERITMAFRDRVLADPELEAEERKLSDLLTQSLRDVYPVVWETYDPNWREFILSIFALILEEYDHLLPSSTVERMESAAREGLKGARRRVESGLTPLNTNVKVLHAFIFDAYSRRFLDSELAEYAAAFSARLLAEYRELHAVAEFNSPTYNGVVLSYTGLLRTRGGSAPVRELGAALEAGLWADFADFYNPAMRNLCGPFSRAYDMTMDGTAFPMLFYLGLEEIPEDRLPPYSGEAESACILCLTETAIPESVKPLLTASRPERTVTRSFRELAERGDPRANRGLCTATAWISDELMLGAVSGSTNTSYQLHAASGCWKNRDGSLSTLRLRRRTRENELVHMRTVFLDMKAEKQLLSGTVQNGTPRPIRLSWEIDSPWAARGSFRENEWQVGGLECRYRMLRIGPNTTGKTEVSLFTEIRSEREVWLSAELAPGETMEMRLMFSTENKSSIGGNP